MDPLSAPRRPRVATVWLGGCSGCHMSLLDMDERLLDLAGKMDLVFSPLADVKRFPEAVDVTLVEGAVCNEEHLQVAWAVRARSRLVVSFGDCAGTGNVTAIRNSLGSAAPVLDRTYLELADLQAQRPLAPGIVPALLDRVLPLHQVIQVDVWLPGCPPSADLIHAVLQDLLAGRTPDLAGQLRFG